MAAAVKVFVLAGFVICALSTEALGQRIYNESGGVVVMEMENTESPLGKWGFIGPGADSTYPTGAMGTGHLEYQGPFTNPTPGSTLKYQFKINQSGNYTLWLRAHKRLLGNASDKNNDAFIKLEGDFTSTPPDVPGRHWFEIRNYTSVRMWVKFGHTPKHRNGPVECSGGRAFIAHRQVVRSNGTDVLPLVLILKQAA